MNDIQNSATKIDYNPWLEQYNKTCFVIGGGPSLINFKWEVLNDKFVVGINCAYQFLPEAQVIYFTDDDWWNTHQNELRKHKGIKIKGSLNPKKLSQDSTIYQFKLSGPVGLDMSPGHLKHGSNSTYAVLNMLCQWRFKKVYLLGIDMQWKKVDNGGNKGNFRTHFHTLHKRIDGESLYPRLIRNFNEIAPLLKTHGMEIVNVNDNSKLDAFPKMSYKDIFGDCFTL